jgi:ADP-heptose:LPS heptosyltransferase
MKILVLSLLRLGDIFMTTPALRGLRRTYPNAKIHLLVNDSFVSCRPLLPFVDEVLGFARADLQKGLGEADRSLFEPHSRLQTLVHDLNEEKYDLILNFTHTKLSGWLASLIDAKEKKGLVFDETGRAHYGSVWFEYLNSQTAEEGEKVFHYSDVFQFASGLQSMSPFIQLAESADGRKEAEQIVDRDQTFVAFQCLTSDTKKDWGLQNWQAMAQTFSSFQPQTLQIYLASPNEEKTLKPFVAELVERGVLARLAVCSLPGALSLLHRAQAFVTGDTSIKHLACATSVPIVELSLGPSDYHRTGAYKRGAWILQSRETCAPCSHSKACHREAHFCSSRISPDCVASVLRQISSGLTHQIRLVAEEFKDDVEILQTDIRASGLWNAYSLAEDFSEDGVAKWLDRSGRKLYLEGRAQRLDWLGDFAEESERLSNLLRKIYPSATDFDWQALLGQIESHILGIEARVIGFQKNLKTLNRDYQDPKKMQLFVKSLISFRGRLKGSPFLRLQNESLDSVIEDENVNPFLRFRRIVDAINEIDGRLRIELKLIRTLQGQMEISHEQQP